MPETFIPKPPAVIALEQQPAQTDPARPGVSTSEFTLSLIVSIIGALIAGASVTLNQLQDLLPGSHGIGVAVGIAGGLATMVAMAMKFVGSRTDIKTALISADTTQQAIAAGQAKVVTGTATRVGPSP